MAAFGFQSGDRPAARNFPNPCSTDAPGGDVSALRLQEGGTGNISGGDVARACVHFHVVIAGYSDLELHPELGVGEVCGLGKARAGNFHAGGRSSGLEGVILQELCGLASVRVRFDVHGITHDRRRTCFDGRDIYRAEVRDKPQGQPFFGFENATAKNRSARRARIFRESSGVFCARGGRSGRKLRHRNNPCHRPEQDGVARPKKSLSIRIHLHHGNKISF